MNVTLDSQEVGRQTHPMTVQGNEFSRIRWIHKIDLGDGRVTPGIWAYEEGYGLEHVDFAGKSVLDVGCIDGMYSFYAERRGASRVFSFDIADEQFGPQQGGPQDWTAGYKYAHKALGSKAEYRFPLSVYDLDPDSVGTFDVVLCLGVIYHLMHPALALERINGVLNMGGTLIVETEVSEGTTRFHHRLRHNPSFATVYRKPIVSMRAAMARVIEVARQLKPWKVHDSGDVYRGDVTNFWVMSPEVIQRHLDAAGFRIEQARYVKPRRLSYRCSKVALPDPMFAAGPARHVLSTIRRP